MKTEERKKEDCKLLDRLLNKFDSMQNYRLTSIIDEFHDFKVDNDLLPNLSHNRWIVDSKYTKWMAYYDTTNNTVYGTNFNGKWFMRDHLLDPDAISTQSYATHKEINKRLLKLAVEMGYAEGVMVESIITKSPYVIENQITEYDECSNRLKFGGVTIMQRGRWTKIINGVAPQVSVQDKIDELDKLQSVIGTKIQELKKMVWK